MRILFKHCHIVVDDKREYLDGSILINDQYIEDVFINTKERDIESIKTVDVQGKIIMPSFFDSKAKEEKDVGVTNKLVFSKKILDIPVHLYTEEENIKDNKNVIAITMKGNYLKNNLIKTLSDPSNKINIFADGVSDITKLKTLSFDSLNMLNYAIGNNCYVEFGIDNTISDEYIRFILKNIDKDKLSLIGYEHDSFINQIKRLYKLNVSLTDIVAMSSLNALRFYGLDKLNGSIIKGKYADMICLDDELNVEFVLNKGMLDA